MNQIMVIVVLSFKSCDDDDDAIVLYLELGRGERTVKSLRLSKALTVPETTTVYEACRRMAARKVDALLLTDSNALLCGILTDKVNLDFFL